MKLYLLIFFFIIINSTACSYSNIDKQNQNKFIQILNFIDSNISFKDIAEFLLKNKLEYNSELKQLITSHINNTSKEFFIDESFLNIIIKKVKYNNEKSFETELGLFFFKFKCFSKKKNKTKDKYVHILNELSSILEKNNPNLDKTFIEKVIKKLEEMDKEFDKHLFYLTLKYQKIINIKEKIIDIFEKNNLNSNKINFFFELLSNNDINNFYECSTILIKNNLDENEDLKDLIIKYLQYQNENKKLFNLITKINFNLMINTIKTNY